MIQSLPKDKRAAVFTNPSGASESPRKTPFMELLSEISKAGCKLILIGDNDEPGQKGLEKWNRLAQQMNCDVLTWTPPKMVLDCEVKDVREFLLSPDVTIEDVFVGCRVWDVGCGEKSLNQNHHTPSTTPHPPLWNKTPEDHGKKKRRVAKIIHLEDLKPEPVQWFWENKIPQGAITLLAGREGIGKTFWSTYLAAKVSLGGTWPDGTPVPKGSVVFFPGEDNPSTSLIPRLLAQGADLSKIKILGGIDVLQGGEKVDTDEIEVKDTDEIKDGIAQTEGHTGEPVRLVVIDPISNFWGKTKENDNSEVRNALRPISRLAEETGAAFLLITHFSKGQKDDYSDRIIGSVALRTVARAVHHIYKDHERKGYRFIVPVKGNDLVDPTGVEFLINKQENGQVEIVNASVEKDAYDFEDAERRATDHGQGRGRKPDKSNEAFEWLERFLSDGRKPVGSTTEPIEGTVRHESAKAGISWGTIRRVKDELGVVITKGFGQYYWTLKEHDEEDQNQVAQNSPSCTLGNFAQPAPCDLRGETAFSAGCAKLTDIQELAQPENTSPAEPAQKSLILDPAEEVLDGPHNPVGGSGAVYSVLGGKIARIK